MFSPEVVFTEISFVLLINILSFSLSLHRSPNFQVLTKVPGGWWNRLLLLWRSEPFYFLSLCTMFGNWNKKGWKIRSTNNCEPWIQSFSLAQRSIMLLLHGIWRENHQIRNKNSECTMWVTQTSSLHVKNPYPVFITLSWTQISFRWNDLWMLFVWDEPVRGFLPWK